MFSVVEAKLKRAQVFLAALEAIDVRFGGLPYVTTGHREELNAMVDGFLFECWSAVEVFYECLNKHFELNLRRLAVNPDSMAKILNDRGMDAECKAMRSILEDIGAEGSWQSVLKRYRDCTTHRTLLSFATKGTTVVEVDREVYEKVRIAAEQGKLRVKPLTKDQIDSAQARGIPQFATTEEEFRVHLYADPENPELGEADTELLQYCSETLAHLRSWLQDKHDLLIGSGDTG